MNYWTTFADELAPEYARSAGTLTFELALRALSDLPLDLAGANPVRVADIGGGCGQLAIALAHKGYETDIVDIDQQMLAYAEALLAGQQREIAGKIRLFLGDGSDAARLLDRKYDIVTCHSVLMYEHDPSALISALSSLLKPGGYASIIAVNPDCLAMRAGLRQQWREALQILYSSEQAGEHYRPTANHRWQDVLAEMQKSGGTIHGRYGIGVFTDHLRSIEPADFSDIFELEWEAGSRDPYRNVARCYHLIVRFGGQ